MVPELFIAGAIGAFVSVGTFGKAVHETVKLTSLRKIWDDTVQEPVPDKFQELLDKLD